MASLGTRPGLIRFGPFALDPTSRELRKRGSLVKLQPQQFAVLLLLAERAGQLVSREEIHQHIWGNDTFVDFERGINFSINQIRAALGDDADKPRYVETIPRRGYRFIALVESDEPRSEDASALVTPISGDRKSTASGDKDQINASPDVNAARAAAPARPLFAKGILIGLSLLAIIAATLLGYRVLRTRAKQTPPKLQFSNMRITQLTSLPGNYWIAGIFSRRQTDRIHSGTEKTGEGAIFTCSWLAVKSRCGLPTPALVSCAVQTGRPTGNRSSSVAVMTMAAVCSSYPHWVALNANLPTWHAPSVRLDIPNGPLTESRSCSPTVVHRMRPPGIVVFSLQTGEKRCLHSPPSRDEWDFEPRLSPDRENRRVPGGCLRARNLYRCILRREFAAADA